MHIPLSFVTCVGKVVRFSNPRCSYYEELTDESRLFEPSLLDPVRPRDTPLKYNTPGSLMNEVLLATIYKHIRGILDAAGMKSHHRMSLEATLEALDPEVKKASPGYPFVMLWKTKQDMIDFAFDTLKLDFNSPRHSGFFCDFPKGDELLKPGKRIRAISGMEFPLLMKMLSLTSQFNSRLKSNERLPLMLGICAVHGGWDRVIRLKRTAQRAAPMDATNHDSCVPQQVMDMVCKLRCSYLLKQEDRELLQALYTNIRDKNLVDLDGTIWITRQGMPSGCVTTAEDNSLSSWFLLYYSMIQATGLTCVEIDERFTMMLYGDDQWLGDKIGDAQFDHLLPTLQQLLLLQGYVIKQEGWKAPFDADFLSRVEKPCHDAIIPVQVRARKHYDSMAFVQRTMVGNSRERALQLIQLRDECIGSEYFVPATHRLFELIGDDPGAEKLLAQLRSEAEIVRFISGHAVAQMAVALNYQLPKMEAKNPIATPAAMAIPAGTKVVLAKPKKTVRVKKMQLGKKKVATSSVKKLVKSEVRSDVGKSIRRAQSRGNTVVGPTALNGGRPPGIVSTNGMHNAAKYVASVYAPKYYPAAPRPTPYPYGSAPMSCRYVVDVPVVLQTTTNKPFSLAIVYPGRLYNQIYCATAIDAAGVITYGTGINHPAALQMTANAKWVQLCGFRTGFVNYENFLEKGGKVRCGNVINLSQSVYVPVNISDINNLLTLRTVPMNQELTGEATSLCWVPIDETAVGFCDPGYNAALNGSDMRMSQVLLYFAAWETADGTLPALEVSTNHTFIPYESVAHLYRADIAIGSDADIAAVEAFIFKGRSPLDIVNGVGADFSFDGLWETIKSGIGKVLRWTTPIVDTVEKGVGLARNVMGVASSLGLMAEHHKQLALYIAAIEQHAQLYTEGKMSVAEYEEKFPVFESPYSERKPLAPSSAQVRAVLDYIQRTSLPALSVQEEYVSVKRPKP